MNADHNIELFRLSTPELIEAYHKRKEDAELIHAILISRARHYEKTLKENDTLIGILRSSHEMLGAPAVPNDTYNSTEVNELRTRITEALKEYEMLHGQL